MCLSKAVCNAFYSNASYEIFFVLSIFAYFITALMVNVFKVAWFYCIIIICNFCTPLFICAPGMCFVCLFLFFYISILISIKFIWNACIAFKVQMICVVCSAPDSQLACYSMSQLPQEKKGFSFLKSSWSPFTHSFFIFLLLCRWESPQVLPAPDEWQLHTADAACRWGGGQGSLASEPCRGINGKREINPKKSCW